MLTSSTQRASATDNRMNPNNVELRERVLSLKLPTAAVAPSGFNWGRWCLAIVLLSGLGATVWYNEASRHWLRNLVLFTSADTKTAESNPTTTKTDVAASSDPVTAAPPATVSAATSAAIVLESKGYIVPAHQILVSPKVTGMVVRLNLEEGRRVNKGEVLAELESIEYQRDVERATAAFDSARARLAELQNGSRPEEIAQAEAELGQAKEEVIDLERTLRRQRELAKQNATTEQELQRSESQYLATLRRIDRLTFALQLLRKGPREERILAAQADVRQSEAELNKARWRLDNCRIVAPISGTILKKNAEEGNIVNALAFNGSFSLCEMADLADLEVDLAIQERDIAKIAVGQRCRVRTEAFPDRLYDGYVSRLMPIADRAKGAVPVRVKVQVPAAEEGQFLKPEMGAIVSFYARDRGTTR